MHLALQMFVTPVTSVDGRLQMAMRKKLFGRDAVFRKPFVCRGRDENSGRGIRARINRVGYHAVRVNEMVNLQLSLRRSVSSNCQLSLQTLLWR